MKQLFSIFILSQFLLATVSAEDGFVPLLNGRDLTGWTNVNCAPDTWTVTNGLLACTGTPIGELRTTRMYQNFVLEVEWRHLRPKGNAGIFVWADALTARGVPFIRGIEVQVLDGMEGDWFTSDGDIFPIHGAKMTPLNGRGGDRAFPTEKRMKPSPEWNHYRIECVDGAIALAVNGEVVTRGHSASPRKGYICLESEGSPVEFRNMRIKELPVKTALPPEHIAKPDEGFQSLYTGVDLSGWQATPALLKHWKTKDWILEHDGGRAENEPHLWSEEEYGDFILVADWRWTATPKTNEFPVILPNGNEAKNDDGTVKMVQALDAGSSGIILRGKQDYAVNIWCAPGGSGGISGGGLEPSERAALIPLKKMDAPMGQWNRMIITLRGDRLTVVLNEQTVIENARLADVPAKGRIALQSQGNPIQFSNLFIRRLD